MAGGINQVDPQWAWSPYEPDAQHPWNRRLAAHLFRRAGFSANRRQLQEAVEVEPAVLVNRLLTGSSEATEAEAEFEQLDRAMLATGDSRRVAAAWLYRLVATPDPLREKATLFWHGHFATSAAKVDDAGLMLEQNRILRRHALGDFSQMVQEISRDPAMLLYLDSITNRKSHPNENYARELMELFCLGEGHYGERDVQELARCFTGWEVRRKKFHFNRYQHDFADKSILGEAGPFGGAEAVRVVLKQPAAPRFIARKLFRYLVCDEPEANDALLEPLAEEFRRHDLQVAPLVERILGSQLFFSEYAIGRKIRSPIELGVGLLRCLEATTDVIQLADRLNQLGHGLFYPPNVKGWEGGRRWIDSATLLGRANLVGHILQSPKTRFAGGTLGELLRSRGLRSAEEKIEWFLELLVAVPVPADVRRRLVLVARDTAGDEDQRMTAVIHTISTLPEFQLN